jgi:hypothetical protein
MGRQYAFTHLAGKTNRLTNESPYKLPLKTPMTTLSALSNVHGTGALGQFGTFGLHRANGRSRLTLPRVRRPPVDVRP